MKTDELNPFERVNGKVNFSSVQRSSLYSLITVPSDIIHKWRKFTTNYKIGNRGKVVLKPFQQVIILDM